MNNKLIKSIRYIYLIMFFIILPVICFMGNTNYPLQRNHIISNYVIILFLIPIIYILSKNIKEREIKKHYYKYLIGLYLFVFILQCILIKNIYFYSDWDVKAIRDIVEKYFVQKNLHNEYYLTIYPNNIILTTILILLKKIPLIGSHYVNTLYFNALVVNISGILINMSFNNIKNNKSLYINYIIIPLIILSPWITIPYSDTYALLFVSLLFYIYTKEKKKNVDYFLLTFVAIIGYYIKPTVLILLIAIIITEILYYKKEVAKRSLKTALFIILGVVFALGINKLSIKTIDFTRYGNGNLKSFNYIHYLAMGENNETNGLYSQDDIDETVKYGTKYNINKFKKRLFERNVKEQFQFFANKTLINFNDGSFSWGQEGVFFYKIIKTNSSFSKKIRSFYYPTGKNYRLFLQITQIIWLFVLMLCPFIIKKDNSKKELSLILSLIGITIFLTIFEPRTRYLYCYSGLFVICSMLGLENIKNINIIKKIKHK